ncbi:hypothetical protein ACIXIX_00895 [Bacteroides fragilis]
MIQLPFQPGRRRQAIDVLFLFSRTKIGRRRSFINDRYAISAQNILRSCVVRYFLPKFIAGCPSVS